MENFIPRPPEYEKRRRWPMITVLALALIAGGVATGFALYYRQQVASIAIAGNPQNSTADETARLVTAIGKLYALPTGEEPTIATVSDPAKLKDQPFFANAQKGDKVLVYAKAQKAILYRPITNRIIEVAPLSASGTTAPTGTP